MDTPSESSVQWTVQLDPLTLALGFPHLQVERAFGDHLAVYTGPHLRLFDGILSQEPEDYIGLGWELGVRYFPFGAAPTGFWTSLRGVGARITAGDLSTFGGYASALAGYTLVLGERWVLAGGAGVQYLHYYIDGMGTRGIAPALHTAFGVAW